MIVEVNSKRYELKKYGDLDPYTYYSFRNNPLNNSDWVAINGIGSTFYPIITDYEFCIGEPFSITDHCLQIGRSLSSQEIKDLQKYIVKRRKRMIFNCVIIIFLFLIFCFSVGLIGAVTKDTTSTPILFLSMLFIIDVCFLLLKS